MRSPRRGLVLHGLGLSALVAACTGPPDARDSLSPRPHIASHAMTAHILVVGLDVFDADAYATYRSAMEPLHADAGGAFVLDVDVARAHRSPDDAPLSRLLMIRFPNAGRAASFFASPRYEDVKARTFARGARSARVLARFAEVAP